MTFETHYDKFLLLLKFWCCFQFNKGEATSSLMRVKIVCFIFHCQLSEYVYTETQVLCYDGVLISLFCWILNTYCVMNFCCHFHSYFWQTSGIIFPNFAQKACQNASREGKISKFSWGWPPRPPQWEGETPSHTHPRAALPPRAAPPHSGHSKIFSGFFSNLHSHAWYISNINYMYLVLHIFQTTGRTSCHSWEKSIGRGSWLSVLKQQK